MRFVIRDPKKAVPDHGDFLRIFLKKRLNMCYIIIS